jgi:hypothetical protein
MPDTQGASPKALQQVLSQAVMVHKPVRTWGSRRGWHGAAAGTVYMLQQQAPSAVGHAGLNGIMAQEDG